MIERTFGSTDQEEFAAWSGDRNPLHLSPDWATHVYPGDVVVHGMHLVMWLLDSCLRSRPLTHLAVTFVRPVLLGERVTGRSTYSDNSAVIIALVREKVVARVDVEFGTGREIFAAPKPSPRRTEARVHNLGTLAAAAGQVPIPAAPPLNAAFPHLYAAIGETALCGLASLSTLVGMECPGLWSLFAELEVNFDSAGGPLRYRVSNIDGRFSRITMSVGGCGLTGRVVALAGQEHNTEADQLEAIAGLVDPDEFVGQSPLVVGAATGLGAVSAMILASGGARPVITVHRSISAGEQLCERIIAAGGHCDLLHLDVNEPDQGLQSLAKMGWQGESLLYFASPRIFRRRLETFQEMDFSDFVKHYVTGFYELVQAVSDLRRGKPLKVFYPSSVAVETPSPAMLEYVLAKQVGEELCRVLTRSSPNLRILVERLPRTDTRQTRSFIQAEAAAPVKVLLPILRQLLG